MPSCPACNKPLERVEQSPNSPRTAAQFEADKAGDWFCRCHDNGRGSAPFAYYFTTELESGLLVEN